jgi:hypothetical protein
MTAMAAGACKGKEAAVFLSTTPGIGSISTTSAATAGTARRKWGFHVKHLDFWARHEHGEGHERDERHERHNHRDKGTRIFCGVSRLFSGALVAVGLVLAALFPAPVSAAIYKCVGADGKAVFSDQPCLAGQTTTAVREPAAGPGPKPKDAKDVRGEKDSSEAARASARERLRASQTPECADLTDRIARYGQTGGATAANAEMTSILNRYDQLCAPAQREAINAENKRNEDAANKRILADAACSEKRRVLNDRRAKLSTLSESDKRAFAVVEAETARDCR